MVGIKARVGPKGQIVIPKVFRNEFNIAPGDEVMVTESEQTLIIKKSAVDPIKTFSDLAQKIKWRTKVNAHAIEEEYTERWKNAQHAT